MSISVFLLMTGVGMIMFILPQKIIEQTGSGDKVGLLASAFAVSYVFSQIPIGRLADKIGFKPLLVSGYYLCFCASILYYFSDTPGSIFAGRFIQGLGEVPVWALSPALLSLEFPEMKARAIGTYTAVFHIGLATGPVLGVMFQKTVPGNQIFLVSAFLCLAGALVIQSMVRMEKTADHIEKIQISRGTLADFTAVLSNRFVLTTFIGIAFYGIGYGTFITVIPVYLINIKQLPSVTIGIYFSIFYLAICLSQLVTGPLSDKYGRIRFMVSGLLIAAICLASFPFFDAWKAVATLGFAGLGFGCFYLSSLAYLNEIVPGTHRGVMSGAYFLSWGIGYFGGPLLISWLERFSGPGYGFFTFSFFIAGIALALVFFKKFNHFLKV